jgi:DNA (cytosine-5)-methyltransferase 1
MRHADGAIVTPEIRDVERLQDFEADWELPAEQGRKGKKGVRWRLVGNAVSVPVALWVAGRIVPKCRCAAAGFLHRARASTLRFPPGFQF